MCIYLHKLTKRDYTEHYVYVITNQATENCHIATVKLLVHNDSGRLYGT